MLPSIELRLSSPLPLSLSPLRWPLLRGSVVRETYVVEYLLMVLMVGTAQ